MISPAQQKIIQIDITNACPRQCSNCTRFCGHHARPFFMTMPEFRAAVDGLDGYRGMVGMMGGEPTIHPHFREMTEYLAYRRPDPPPPSTAYAPIDDMAEYRRLFLADLGYRKGLFTGLGPGYERHYEIIQQTYRYQCINDHAHPSRHIALLMDRREIGVPDDEWLQLRDACWVQNKWSASITPKGAYFCEVAAARAMLFGGPDGWPVEPGWWRRTPEHFGSQLDLCEGCSACLPVPTMATDAETDHATPEQAERLRSMGSRKKLCIVRPTWEDMSKGRANQDPEPYIDRPDQRAKPTRHRRQIVGVVVCVGYDDYLRETIRRNLEVLDQILVVTTPGECQWVQDIDRAAVFETDAFTIDGAPFRKGLAIATALAWLRDNKASWVLVHDADIVLPRATRATLEALWLNPGGMYYATRAGPRRVEDIPAALDAFDSRDGSALDALMETNRMIPGKPRRSINPVECTPSGYFQLINLAGSTLADRTLPYPHNSQTAERDDMDLYRLWYGLGKCHALPLTVMHLPHGPFKGNWAGRVSGPIPGQPERAKVL